MPVRIEDALDFPVVREVMQVVGEKTVCRYLEFELIKLSTLLSVGGNLNNAQIPFIAQQLVSIFPNETLADFKLCFQRGAFGQYNHGEEKDIFRMDGIVIRRWMEQYLEEKYQVIEDKLKQERDDQIDYRKTKNPKQVRKTNLIIGVKIPNDTPLFFTPVISKEAREQCWLAYARNAITPGKKVPSISVEEIKANGKQQPPKKSAHTAGWAYFTVEGYKIYAGSQEQAEEQYAIMVKNKMIKSEKA